MLKKVLLVALPVFCLGLVVFFVRNRIIGVQQVECGKWELLRDFPFEPGSLGGYANAIAAVSKDDVWVVGEGETRDYQEIDRAIQKWPMIMHWDGKSLNAITNIDPDFKSYFATLVDVAAISADDAWAVGYYVEEKSGQQELPLILHWDGKLWTFVSSPPINVPRESYYGSKAGLKAIRAVSTDDVWIAGAYEGDNGYATLIEHWDGSQWKIVPSPNMEIGDSWLHSLAVVSADDIWASGGSMVAGALTGCEHELVLHWDGKQWSMVDVSSVAACDHSISGLAASGPTDVWIVGHSSSQMTLVEHWDGKSWSVVNSPDPSPEHGNYLTGVAMVSPDEGWAVGDQFQIIDMGDWKDNVQQAMTLHWDGKEWLEVAAPTPYASQRLRDVAIVAPNEVWVVGGYAPSDILEWIPSPLVARYVACSSSAVKK